eukprot:1609258-Pyramimonas_sp.AAC.1
MKIGGMPRSPAVIGEETRASTQNWSRDSTYSTSPQCPLHDDKALLSPPVRTAAFTPFWSSHGS